MDWRASDRGGGHHARVVSQCAAPDHRGRRASVFVTVVVDLWLVGYSMFCFRERSKDRQAQTRTTPCSCTTAPPSTTPPHVSRGRYLRPTAPPPRGSHSTAGRANRLARVCTSGRGCTLAWALAGAAAPRSVGETCAWKRSGTQRTKAASAGMEALRQGEGAWMEHTGSCVSIRQTTTLVVRGLGREFLCLSVCLRARWRQRGVVEQRVL